MAFYTNRGWRDRGSRIAGGVKFLLVDGCPSTLAGMRQFLSQFPETEVAGETSCADQARRLVAEYDYDYVVIDPEFGPVREFHPEVVEDLKASPGSPCVVVHTYHQSPSGQAALMTAGTDHYVHKSVEAEKLVGVAEKIDNRERVWLLPAIESSPAELLHDYMSQFTGIQREVFWLILEDLSVPEIARRLFRAEGTVKKHVTTILRVCEVRSCRQLRRKFNG